MGAALARWASRVKYRYRGRGWSCYGLWCARCKCIPLLASRPRAEYEFHIFSLQYQNELFLTFADALAGKSADDIKRGNSGDAVLL
jgi:hypothetical protein